MMAIPGFIFGGSAPARTPEELARQREVIHQLMASRRSPRTVGEGLNAIGDGIVAASLRHRADTAEKTGRASASSAFDSLFSGGTPESGAPISTAPSAVPSQAASTGSSAPIDTSGNGIYSSFIDTVKNGGVANPYALAAISATGNAESKFSPGNVNRTWNDGANDAGGIMSWNGPRLASLQKYAASKGETGNGSPQTQAEFFLQENPDLIAGLNNAGSVKDAIGLMNNAWRFKGYNDPNSPDAAHRLELASAYLPKFEGNGGTQAIQAASPLPPPGAAGEVAATNPTPQAVSPQQTASLSPVAAPPVPGSPQPGGNDPWAGLRTVSPQYRRVAQAMQSRSGGPSVQQLAGALNNPWLSDGQKAVVGALLKQKMQASDPSNQLDMEYKRAQLNRLEHPAPSYGFTAMPDGTVLRINKATGQAEPAYHSGPSYKTLTPEEVKQMGLPPGTYQRGADGKLAAVSTPTQPQEPSSVREYEFYVKQAQTNGQKPLPYNDWQLQSKKAGATTINNNMGSSGIDYGKPEKGLVWQRNPDGSVKTDERGAPIAIPYQGGPVYRKQQNVDKTNQSADETKAKYANVVLKDIGRVRKAVKDAPWYSPVTGIGGSIMKNLPASGAYDTGELVKTIKANVGFDRLQEMRNSSPTGGALGQVTERELDLLQSALDSLDQAQSEDQFLQNLNNVGSIYQHIVTEVEKTGDPVKAGMDAAPVGSSPKNDPLGIR